MPDVFTSKQHKKKAAATASQSSKNDTAEETKTTVRSAQSERPVQKKAQEFPSPPVLKHREEADEGPLRQAIKTIRRHVDEYSAVMRAESPTANPLNAFAPKPVGVYFDTQDEEERIVLLLRKSLITQIRWVVVAIFMFFMPLLFAGIGFLDILPVRYQFASLIIWYLVLTGFVLESFLTWFFNVYIITDERVIDVDFLSLIYKNISSAKIDNVEDITAVTSGALRSIFNFGTVKIQTAGSEAELDFEDVPQPAKVTRLLNELLLEEEREKIEGRVR